MYAMQAWTHPHWPEPARAAWDEPSLVAAAQRGEVEAFNQLVLAHQPRLYSAAYCVLGDAAAAADATQEALIAAYRSLHTFSGGSFKNWLYRIVTRKCYDYLRDVRRRRSTSLDALPDDQTSRWASQDELPEAAVQRREAARRLDAALSTLPFAERQMVVLRDVQGLDYAAIAAATRRPVGTVKSKLSRARARLRGQVNPGL